MSYNWCFHSFDYKAFEREIGSSRQRIVDQVLGDISESNGYRANEIEVYQRLGAHIIERGFRYDDCEKAELKIMDRFVFDTFHILSEEIDFQAESSEFLSPYVTCDLPSHLYKRFFWSRPQPIEDAKREYSYLPFFTHLGRRLGQSIPSECEYVALKPTEVSTLEAEILKFLSTPEGKTLDESYDQNITNDFLGPVRSTLKKRKALHAQVS